MQGFCVFIVCCVSSFQCVFVIQAAVLVIQWFTKRHKYVLLLIRTLFLTTNSSLLRLSSIDVRAVAPATCCSRFPRCFDPPHREVRYWGQMGQLVSSYIAQENVNNIYKENNLFNIPLQTFQIFITKHLHFLINYTLQLTTLYNKLYSFQLRISSSGTSNTPVFTIHQWLIIVFTALPLLIKIYTKLYSLQLWKSHNATSIFFQT